MNQPEPYKRSDAIPAMMLLAVVILYAAVAVTSWVVAIASWQIGGSS